MSQEKKDRKSINSAIGSWSGYIFQGLCAIYVVLKYLYEELQDNQKKEKYKNYIFYLDSYNDFSIHREDNIAVSLHQCKVYKDKQNFKEDQKQLLDQKVFLEKHNICDSETKLYFHCNHRPDILEGVIQYEYEQGEFTYGPKELISGIKNLVGNILLKSNTARSVHSICSELYNLVDSQVLCIHQNSLEEKGKLSDLARDRKYAIKFEQIRNILYTDVIKYCQESEFWLMAKINFIEELGEVIDEYESLEDWEDKNSEYIMQFIDSVKAMKEEEFFNMIKRIIPAEKKEISSMTLINIVNKATINELLTIIGKSKEKLSNQVDWNVNNQFESPAFFSQSSERIICRTMYKLSYNLDCLREYDWLVHNRNFSKIDNCWDYIKKITDVDESDDRNNIFKEKKIGLLSIEYFNNGKYY